MNRRHYELAILLCAILFASLSPLWYMATDKGMDEVEKTIMGVLQAAACAAVIHGYRTWKSNGRKKGDDDDGPQG